MGEWVLLLLFAATPQQVSMSTMDGFESQALCMSAGGDMNAAIMKLGRDNTDTGTLTAAFMCVEVKKHGDKPQ